MKELKDLKQVSDLVLSDLKADDELKYKILTGVVDHVDQKRKWLRFIPAMCCGLALVIGAAIMIPTFFNNIDNEKVVIQSFAAGNADFGNGVLKASGTGLVNDSISLTAGKATNKDSILATYAEGTPIIAIKDRFYRLLTEPAKVPSNLKTTQIGNSLYVTDVNSISDGIRSNCIADGAAVFDVKNGTGSWIIATVNGVDRLFQRITWNGRGIVNGESFDHIAPLNEKWISMQLQGYGTVKDPVILNDLASLLKNQAVFDGNSTVSSGKSLIIVTESGLSYEFTVKGDRLSSCGTWICPEFFEMLTTVAK